MYCQISFITNDQLTSPALAIIAACFNGQPSPFQVWQPGSNGVTFSPFFISNPNPMHWASPLVPGLSTMTIIINWSGQSASRLGISFAIVRAIGRLIPCINDIPTTSYTNTNPVLCQDPATPLLISLQLWLKLFYPFLVVSNPHLSWYLPNCWLPASPPLWKIGLTLFGSMSNHMCIPILYAWPY